MQLLSINIGTAQPFIAKPVGQTGIFKQPVSEPVWINRMGLDGDAICDTENHGGADQAVYVFGEPDYAWWSAHLGRELLPGTFGENLTISELESAQFSIGDRLHLPQVVLEVTAPRIPCVTLATRMGDPAFLKKFRAAERFGLYCRVIRPGFVQVGEVLTWERYTQPTITALEMFRDFYEPDRSEANLRRHLAAPICIRDRVEKEVALRNLGG
ncbi:MAG: MOSC domain-containing protein [Anaerolineae bacterium]|nr:MOSC domain-containing protein [Anaerolineae bacterium]